ncbi:hypothetical protein GGX14DRAFT_392302 [Mycena pura]|uniref:Uncharacterized protein n=1 Tax=Mycena pura TaxID=153505 RepID=A0AAD6VJR7_9AGAR|nr:hypothetical protein GGX14DRAFT_392302 [Mycena pura]
MLIGNMGFWDAWASPAIRVHITRHNVEPVHPAVADSSDACSLGPRSALTAVHRHDGSKVELGSTGIGSTKHARTSPRSALTARTGSTAPENVTKVEYPGSSGSTKMWSRSTLHTPPKRKSTGFTVASSDDTAHWARMSKMITWLTMDLADGAAFRVHRTLLCKQSRGMPVDNSIWQPPVPKAQGCHITSFYLAPPTCSYLADGDQIVMQALKLLIVFVYYSEAEILLPVHYQMDSNSGPAQPFLGIQRNLRLCNVK